MKPTTSREPNGSCRSLRQAEDLPLFNRQFNNSLRVILARVQLERGEKASAGETARAVCRAPSAEQPNAVVLKLLNDSHLCD